MEPNITGGWFDQVYSKNKHLWLATNALLEIILKAGMPMSRTRMAKFSLDDPETIGVYVLDLAEAGITAADVARDAHEVRRQLSFFPSSSELVQLFKAKKVAYNPPWLVVEPVYVWVDGNVRMTNRQSALIGGLEMFDHPDDCQKANTGTKALPGRKRPELPSKDGQVQVDDMVNQVATKLGMPQRQLEDGVTVNAFGRIRMSKEKMASVEAEIKQKAEWARAQRAQREAAAG